MTTVSLRALRTTFHWLVAFVALAGPAAGLSTATAADLELKISTEDDVKANLTATIAPYPGGKAVGTPQTISCPGNALINLDGLEDGECMVRLKGDTVAGQWHKFDVKGGRPTPDVIKVMLYKKRYVILDYAINMAGRRSLNDKTVKTGVCAVSHWGAVGVFRQDWQVWQMSETRGGMWGTAPRLQHHRLGPDFGFAVPAAGAVYEDLTEAPDFEHEPGTPAIYECEPHWATPGLILYVRTCPQLSRDIMAQFGKLRVREVVMKVPEGIEVFERRE